MSEHVLDDMLPLVLEGDADEATSVHVAACSECRARVEALGRLTGLLEKFAPASRNLCPPRAELAAGGRLVAAHVALCPLCRDDLADLAALETPSRLVLAVRLVRGMIEVVENALGELVPGPAPVFARGGEGGHAVLVHRDLGAGAVLEVALAPGREGTDVLVTLPGRFRVELARNGRVLEGREAHEGRVLLDGVSPGSYELSVIRSGEESVNLALEITRSE
ncbi:MAG TPA: hypothetical protein VFF73_42400 [Planctomycetota bacterium]|nr:hypothetical protein [Planctomycetota bacterium]